jgi:hypothetical protein
MTRPVGLRTFTSFSLLQVRSQEGDAHSDIYVASSCKGWGRFDFAFIICLIWWLSSREIKMSPTPQQDDCASPSCDRDCKSDLHRTCHHSLFDFATVLRFATAFDFATVLQNATAFERSISQQCCVLLQRQTCSEIEHARIVAKRYSASVQRRHVAFRYSFFHQPRVHTSCST